MTEERLREMAKEAGLPFAKFLLIAKDALGVDMRPMRLLIPAVCEAVDQFGQTDFEELMKDVL